MFDDELIRLYPYITPNNKLFSNILSSTLNKSMPFSKFIKIQFFTVTLSRPGIMYMPVVLMRDSLNITSKSKSEIFPKKSLKKLLFLTPISTALLQSKVMLLLARYIAPLTPVSLVV